MAARTSAAAARSASTVASAPNRASSARTAGRWRSRSIDGINAESHGDCRSLEEWYAFTFLQSCHPAILQYYDIAS